MKSFSLNNDNALAFAGDTDRYQKNIAALTLLRQLQRDERTADTLTTDEQRTLAHYSAFATSTLLQKFVDDPVVHALTSEDERALVRRTALTAFYTSEEVLHTLWANLAPHLLQLPTLRILEPAFGVGMVIATMPHELRQQATITGVEIDAVSTQIARLLHPDVTLYGPQGFEDTKLDEASFDLVISNVPFSDVPVADATVAPHLRRTLHDYFITRAVTLTRPGGIVAVLTSYGTLSKRDTRVRTWLAERAELISAIRLPHGVFSANAGTQCGTDLLIFHRHQADAPRTEQPSWVATTVQRVPVVETAQAHLTRGSRISAGADEDDGSAAGIRINQYFADHAEQVLGTMQIVRKNHLLWLSVTPPADEAVADVLNQRLAATLPADLIAAADTRDITDNPPPSTVPAAPRVLALLAVYEAATRVLKRDAAGHDAHDERDDLNAIYDSFVAQYGALHTRANVQSLKGEPELHRLKALESDVQTLPDGTMRARKADLFFRATVRPIPQVVPGSMTPDEALLWCLNECGRVQIERIAALCGQSETDAAAALMGRIYFDPATAKYVSADEYLSGNIREKLADAKRAAEHDATFAAHVTALEAVMPEQLDAGLIRANLGAPWIPADVVYAYLCTLIPSFRGGLVQYQRALSKWLIEDRSDARRSHEAQNVWATARFNALDLFLHACHGTRAVAYDERVRPDSSIKTVANQKETLRAAEKIERMRERFQSWVWEDVARAERLCRIYNEQFRSTRRRDFDGSHLVLPGINTAMLRDGDLGKHQKDAVWMGLQQQTMLIDLCVGAGKTFIGIAWARELVRLGLASKVLFAVPNHLVEQWGSEFNRLYPAMRILVLSPDSFDKAKRGTVLNRIATERWDAIVVPHTTFGFIAAPQAEADFITEELCALREHLELARADTSMGEGKLKKRSIKAIEKKIAAFEVKLKLAVASITHDDARVMTWDTLGVDALFVDEAHEFKNLGVPTIMGNIPGVPNGDSKRAFDMRVKTWDLIRRNGRVVFATGTPVLNTLGEVFIMQKYLQDDVLREHGIEHFDAWARTFAQSAAVFEMTPDGGGFRMRTRLCTFVNLPELFELWYRMTFSRSREQLGLPTPTLVTNKPIAVEIPGSPTLKRLVRSFVGRVEAIKAGKVEPWQDNMLAVTGDGRKAALDIRLLDPGAEADPVNKIGVLADHVAALYAEYDQAQATQLIYCELGTPKRGASTPACQATSAELLPDAHDETASDTDAA